MRLLVALMAVSFVLAAPGSGAGGKGGAGPKGGPAGALYHGWNAPGFVQNCDTKSANFTFNENSYSSSGSSFMWNTGDGIDCIAWKMAATVCITPPVVTANNPYAFSCPVGEVFQPSSAGGSPPISDSSASASNPPIQIQATWDPWGCAKVYFQWTVGNSDSSDGDSIHGVRETNCFEIFEECGGDNLEYAELCTGAGYFVFDDTSINMCEEGCAECVNCESCERCHPGFYYYDNGCVPCCEAGPYSSRTGSNGPPTTVSSACEGAGYFLDNHVCGSEIRHSYQQCFSFGTVDTYAVGEAFYDGCNGYGVMPIQYEDGNAYTVLVQTTAYAKHAGPGAAGGAGGKNNVGPGALGFTAVGGLGAGVLGTYLYRRRKSTKAAQATNTSAAPVMMQV